MKEIVKKTGINFDEKIKEVLNSNVCVVLEEGVNNFLDGEEWEFDNEIECWYKYFEFEYSNALASLTDGWIINYVVKYFEENGIAKRLHEKGYFCCISKDKWNATFEVLIKRLE